MKRIFVIAGIFAGLGLSSLAQDPAGNSFLIDYEEYLDNSELHYINCGNDGSLNPGANLTIEAWVKPYSTEWNQKIAGKNNPSFNSGYLYGMTTGRIYTEVWTPGGSELIEGFMPPVPNPYYWVHMVLVYDGTSQKGYINGEFVGEEPASGDIAANSDDFIIGIAPWDLANFQFFGQVDEMRVWNIALSEEQIKANMFFELNGSEDGLVAYYKFNESTGLSLPDHSSNDNTGTLNSNCDDSNWAPSRAVIAQSDMETQNDVNGLWNAIGFSDPRFVTTTNGLSLLASNIPEDDYMVFGHDAGSGTSTEDNPATAPADMVHSDRIWYINNVGGMRADLVFDLDNVAGGGDLLDVTQPAENYTLLMRDGTSGEFTAVAGGDSKTGNVVTFEFFEAEDGYYAVAVSSTAVIDDDDASIDEYNGLAFNVLPNPASENMTISLPGSMKASIEIYNTVGQLVFNTNMVNTDNAIIAVDQIPSGVYTLIITNLESGEKGQKRIAIN